MGKIAVSLYLSLDGIMEEPAWTMPYWNDEIAKFQSEMLLFSTDALLLGRETYEGFAAAWPTMKDEDGFADKMNTMPKYVATTTLENPKWNATFIKENFADEVAKLKQNTDQNLLIYGSAQIIRQLMERNLIDDYHLIVHPLVLGKGKRLFTSEMEKKDLKLVDIKTTKTGVTIMSYQPEEDSSRLQNGETHQSTKQVTQP
ncbi:Dihydrofolate reductase [Fictibacillus solisalsi]|uniref:Dihydrofolate reductase n=1 Tax=Fictibacillus solisalsi TaxID=459525 RepID=A0A1G9UMV3_9BACL|nr:dihydrofolate reductase family protein [Fictibacillus solisalsi]SDM61183.1 Dihydrofolate reductase [Fictibacillus solisalsi]